MKFSGLTPLVYLCSIVGLVMPSSEAAEVSSQLPAQSASIANKTQATPSVSAKSELRALLGTFNNFKADFSQEISDMQGQILQESSGTILLQKPQMLRWTVNSPEESLLIADGATVYNVDPFVEQVTLMEQKQLTASNPLMLLISDEEEQWSSVNIEKLDGDFIVRTIDKNAPVSLVVLSFNEQQQLSLLTSVDKQQQRNAISFTNIVLNSKVAPGTFSFEPDPSWVVDDQRAQQ